MTNNLTIEDYNRKVGQMLGQSDWLLVDQAMIDQFALVTKDDQFIHTDPILAAQTQFGGTIAHGYLSLSLLTFLCNQAAPVPSDAKVQINYGLNKVRFLTPVTAGSHIRASVTLKQITPRRAGQVLFENNVTVEIKETGKTALIATVLALYER